MAVAAAQGRSVFQNMSGVSEFGPNTMRGKCSKMTINIELKNHYKARVYSTGSSIDGTVTITTTKDMPFDRCEITLIGTTVVRVTGQTGAVRCRAYRIMSLPMPILEDVYPEPRIFLAGHTYKLDFHFVVPERLTMHACGAHDLPDIYEHHLRMPPTMGASMGSPSAKWEPDDMAPDMTQIEYAVKAAAVCPVTPDTRSSFSGGSGSDGPKPVEAIHPVRILPLSVADPPMNLTPADTRYRLSAKSKMIRAPPLDRRRYGSLVATASEPSAIVIRPDAAAIEPASVLVDLLFKPACPEALPPQLVGVDAKLVSHTCYSLEAMKAFPNRGDIIQQNYLAIQWSDYRKTVNIPTRPVPEELSWTTQMLAPGQEHADSSDNSDGRGSTAAVPIRYQTQVALPLKLPTDRHCYLPTFYSCASARFYVLDLTLRLARADSKSMPGLSICPVKVKSPSWTHTSVNLLVPLQIVVGGARAVAEMQLRLQALEPGPPSFAAAMEESEAEARTEPELAGMDGESHVLSAPPCYKELRELRR